MKKRIVAFLLVCCMMVSFMPVVAYAATGLDVSTSNIDITSGGDYTITGSTSTNTIKVEPGITGVNITLNNVSVDVSAMNDTCAFDIGDGASVNLTLADGTTNTFNSGSKHAGIKVEGSTSLVIDGTGYLVATGRDNGAGIGGNGFYYAPIKPPSNQRYMGSYGTQGIGGTGSITIENGEITATGGTAEEGGGGGAGIGGGGNDVNAADNNAESGGTINITGGKVNATGGMNAAGIGGGGTACSIAGNFIVAEDNGEGADGGTIYISGGDITAKGGNGDFSIFSGISGAGIGGGNFGVSGNITITNGTINATGGNGGAGIGSGGGSHGGEYNGNNNITIQNGIINATGTNAGAGIGGGGNVSVGTINITGGRVTAISTPPTTSTNAGGAGIGGGGALGLDSNERICGHLTPGNGGTINIAGAIVTAIGTGNGAGIGGGSSYDIATYADGDGSTLTIDSSATVKAASSGRLPAIQTLSGSLESASTAKALMANFTTSKTVNTNTQVYNKSTSSEYTSFAPNVAYQSIAFSVPEGTYQLRTGGTLQQHAGSFDFGIESGLTIFNSVMGAKSGLFAGKYGKAQIFDVQRNPVYPAANQPFTLSDFKEVAYGVPVDWGTNDDRYVQFDDSANQGQSDSFPTAYLVKLNLYEADGTFVRTITNYGTIWGLGSEGFFYEGEDICGYFISNSQGYSYGSDITYTPTTGLITDDKDLNDYRANTKVLDVGETAAPKLAMENVTQQLNGSATMVSIPVNINGNFGSKPITYLKATITYNNTIFDINPTLSDNVVLSGIFTDPSKVTVLNKVDNGTSTSIDFVYSDTTGITPASDSTIFNFTPMVKANAMSGDTVVSLSEVSMIVNDGGNSIILGTVGNPIVIQNSTVTLIAASYSSGAILSLATMPNSVNNVNLSDTSISSTN